MTGELNDTAVVILGGSRNTWDTDRTLGTGELNDTAVVILGGSRNTAVVLGGSGIQTVPYDRRTK